MVINGPYFWVPKPEALEPSGGLSSNQNSDVCLNLGLRSQTGLQPTFDILDEVAVELWYLINSSIPMVWANDNLDLNPTDWPMVSRYESLIWVLYISLLSTGKSRWTWWNQATHWQDFQAFLWRLSLRMSHNVAMSCARVRISNSKWVSLSRLYSNKQCSYPI